MFRRHGLTIVTVALSLAAATSIVVVTADSANAASATREQQGHHGVNTFTNYHNASGVGQRIPASTWVLVSCKVYDPTIVSVSPGGYWYRIASSPWNNRYYAPANTFMNGDPWNGPYRHDTDLAVPDCGGVNTGQGASKTPRAVANPTYNRSAAVSWALAHAQDPQGSGALCAWFVSNALWAGKLPQGPSWRPGAAASRWVDDLVNYLRSNDSVSWTDITHNLTTNAVPAAEPGDLIAYDWDDDGALDHVSFVVGIASGQYPEVSEWGQINFSWHLWYRGFKPRSPYVSRGWTYSQVDHEWLQREHKNMRAYLLHINGGYFLPSY